MKNNAINTHTISTIQQTLILHLQHKGISAPSIQQQLTTKTNLAQLIDAFAQSLQSTPKYAQRPSTTNSLRLQYYQRLLAENEKRTALLNEKVLSLMKAIQDRQNEEAMLEEQIFKWKCTVQQKQKVILKLVRVIYESKIKLNSMQVFNKKQDDHKSVAEARQRQERTDKALGAEKAEEMYDIVSSAKRAQIWEEEKWLQERMRLLKIIKQKDLKIYELIQQMHRCDKSR